MTPEEDLPTWDDVLDAGVRVAPHVHRTPVVTSATLDREVGASVLLKCESFQRVGAFKFRGACNAVFSLSDQEAQRGVATHSSGNHAQAIALAAKLRGIGATIVMPENAPQVKRAAVLGYGASIRLCAPTLASREATLVQVVQETGATPIHPYDDRRVIAGQGTAALELLADHGPVDLLLAPVGGGGLLGGTALVAEAHPGVRVIACEPQEADDAFRSFVRGERVPAVDPTTIADGLRTSIGVRNFALMRRAVDAVVTVPEEEIRAATLWVMERLKLVVEPSAAVPVAALRTGAVREALERWGVHLEGMRVGVILSGGNIDLPAFFR